MIHGDGAGGPGVVSGGRVALTIVNLGNRPGRSFFSCAQLRSRPVRARAGAVRLPAHGTGVYLLRWGR